MAEFQKSKNPKGVVYSKATMLILFVFSAILIAGLFSIIPKERATKENKDLVLNQLDSLKAQSSSLSSEIDSLKTQAGVEDKIREKFRVVKEGEGLVVIVDDKKEADAALSPKSNGFWDFFRNLFK